MLGRRGFFGTLAACFAWLLPPKRVEPVSEWSQGPQPLSDPETNVVIGYDSGIVAGVKNSVVMGQRSIAKKSNVVILGNEKTESLIVGVWEFSTDHRGPYFFNRLTNEKYRLTRDIVDHPPSNAAPGFPAFGEGHALICGGPECPVGSHRNQGFREDALGPRT